MEVQTLILLLLFHFHFQIFFHYQRGYANDHFSAGRPSYSLQRTSRHRPAGKLGQGQKANYGKQEEVPLGM